MLVFRLWIASLVLLFLGFNIRPLLSQETNVYFHAHNDYEREQYLTQALNLNFYSIEIDVFYRDGKFYIAHDEEDINSTFYLKKDYLDPLFNNYKAELSLRSEPLHLLIDFKEAQWKDVIALNDLLAQFDSFFYSKAKPEINAAVKVIISGFDYYDPEFEQLTYIFFDGREMDLSRNISSREMPWVSVSFKKFFNSRFSISQNKKANSKLRALITKVHEQQKLLRFWGTKDDPDLLKYLKSQGVDILVLDDYSLVNEIK